MTTPDKNIINKVIAGQASKEEANEVVNWFASTEGQEHLAELINQHALQLEMEGVDESTIPPFLSKKILQQINDQLRRKRIQRTILRIAAVLIPFVFIVGFAVFTNSRVDLFGVSDYAEIYIPKGEKTRILFQDGSMAIINSDTKIRYPQKFGLINREIQLEGEAYFQIAKNSKRPFIVKLNKTEVEVLGTSFNVKAYKNDKYQNIVLDNGKIIFDTPQNDYNMSPGQEAIYDNATGKCQINSLEKSSDASEWVNDVILFKDTPIADVLKTLNRMYNVEFDIVDPNVYKYTYTLTTNKTSLDKIFIELEKITPLSFQFENDKLIKVSLK